MLLKNFSRLSFRCSIVTAFGILLFWAVEKPLREDELLHLHGAWMVSEGFLFYVDFFEHHACLYHLTLAFAVPLFAPELSFANASAFVLFCRLLSCSISLVGLVALAGFGRLWHSWRRGVLALIILVTTPAFVECTIETRPDVPAFSCWMISLLLLGWGGANKKIPDKEESVSIGKERLGTVDGRPSETGSVHRAGNCFRYLLKAVLVRRSLFAGIVIGLGVIFTQKLLFVVPGLGLTLLVQIVVTPPKFRRKALLDLLLFALGVCAFPFALYLWFVSRNAGGDFLHSVFFVNASWPYREIPWKLLSYMMGDSWITIGFACLGGGVIGGKMIRRREAADWLGITVLSSALLWIVGALFLIPVADQQFLMLFMPMIALLSALGIEVWCSLVSEKLRSVFYGILILVVVAVPTETSVSRMNASREGYQAIHDLQWVLENTNSQDTVLDAWTGAGAFRQQYWHYGFVHREMPSLITAEESAALVKILEQGEKLPAVVANDANLLGLNNSLRKFVATNYVSTGRQRLLLLRKR